MSVTRRSLTVAAVRRLGAYSLLELDDPDGAAPQPGQFAMLAAAERWGGGEDERPFLPRALSIARHREGRSIYLLEDVGPGSARLCELLPGDQVLSLGPLGRPFRAPSEQRRAILVGGGVGIAPMIILGDSFAADGAIPTSVLLGFRDAARARGAELLPGAAIATDDGSVGHHGLITELLEAELEREPHATIYACGPAPMLEGVRAICERRELPGQLALEAAMACGFGACFGCVVPRRGGGYLRVCVEGPVVEAAALEHVEAHAGAPE